MVWDVETWVKRLEGPKDIDAHVLFLSAKFSIETYE